MSIKSTVDDLWSAFDKDNNNFLDRKEARNLLKVVCEHMKMKYTDKLADDIIDDIDKNHDGRITKDELIVALEKI